jgi:hypothetical protein
MKALCVLFLLFPLISQADDLRDLAKKGYAVIEETQVDGEFNGCEYDKKIPLRDQLIFVCTTYSYSYSYSPDVLIMKNIRNGDLKVLIDETQYDGNLYKR